MLREYGRSMRLAPLGAGERARCRLALARFALRHVPKLARDLVIATEHALLGPPR